MRLADYRREHLPTFNECAPSGYSKSLPRLGMSSTSLARAPGKPKKLLGGEFRVSPRYLPCGVSLPGGGAGGVGVDERVEGASGRPPGFILLDVYQVEQAAQICPLVEPHRSVASFDDLNQASDEVEALRTVFPLAANTVDLHGGWLVHVFSPRREGPAGTEGGSPSRTPRLTRP